jgi:hypothetical protein
MIHVKKKKMKTNVGLAQQLELQSQHQGFSTVLLSSYGAFQGSEWPADDSKVGDRGKTAPLPEKEDQTNAR